MGILEGKRVLILGGSRGIGAATVRECIREGAAVGATYHSSENEMREIGEEFKDADFFCRQMDIEEEASVSSAVSGLMEELGGIDVLINSVGITCDRSIAFMDTDSWERVIRTNLTGSFFAVHKVVLPMVSNRQGVILHVSSVSGIAGAPGQVNYAASKAGLIGMTKALSRELGAYNIRVNTVAPGYVETDMTAKFQGDVREKIVSQIPLKRFARPEEIAKLLIFLASDSAGYITGQTIVIDGGLT